MDSYHQRRWTAISTIDTGISTLKNRCVPGIPGRSSATILFNGRAIFLKKRVARAIGKIGNDAPEGIRGTSYSGCDHGRVKETGREFVEPERIPGEQCCDLAAEPDLRQIRKRGRCPAREVALSLWHEGHGKMPSHRFLSFLYCFSVSSSQMPPRPFSIPWSSDCRPSRVHAVATALGQLNDFFRMLEGQFLRERSLEIGIRQRRDTDGIMALYPWDKVFLGASMKSSIACAAGSISRGTKTPRLPEIFNRAGFIFDANGHGLQNHDCSTWNSRRPSRITNWRCHHVGQRRDTCRRY